MSEVMLRYNSKHFKLLKRSHIRWQWRIILQIASYIRRTPGFAKDMCVERSPRQSKDWLNNTSHIARWRPRHQLSNVRHINQANISKLYTSVCYSKLTEDTESMTARLWQQDSQQSLRINILEETADMSRNWTTMRKHSNEQKHVKTSKATPAPALPRKQERMEHELIHVPVAVRTVPNSKTCERQNACQTVWWTSCPTLASHRRWERNGSSNPSVRQEQAIKSNWHTPGNALRKHKQLWAQEIPRILQTEPEDYIKQFAEPEACKQLER